MTSNKTSEGSGLIVSIRKTETVTIERTWWSCFCDAHRHQSQVAAENCMRKDSAPPVTRLTVEFKLEVLARRRAGETLASIGRSLGRTAQRIRQIQRQAERLERTRSDGGL